MAIPIRPEKFAPASYKDPTTGELVNWQLEDLSYLSNRTWSANWSDMGCYKTSTGLWLIDRKVQELFSSQNGNAPDIRPVVLIITTKSGKGTYFDAVPRCMDGWKVYNVQTTKATEVVLGKFEFDVSPDALVKDILTSKDTTPTLIISHYHCFTNKSKMRELLQKITYTMILVDEAHRLKNRNAQWTRNIKLLKTWTELKHAMTGTGFINRPDELWSILNFLEKRTFSSYWRFRRYFCDEINVGGFNKIIGLKADKVEEFRQLRKLVGPRRMLKEVRADIKEPLFTPIEVDLNPTQRKMYDAIRRDLFTLDQKGTPIHSPNVLSQLNRLRQICVATPEKIGEHYDPKLERRVQEIKLVEPSTKLDALMELLEGLRWDAEDKQQVVVFSNFKDPLELLKVRLDKAGIPYLHMRENHNDQQRYQMWHDTWPQKEHQVFMCTLQLGSESINLSAAERCVFLDRSWSPKDNNQGVSRLYRPGQEGQVEVIHINARKTTDQRIEKVNITKMGWFTTIFGDDE